MLLKASHLCVIILLNMEAILIGKSIIFCFSHICSPEIMLVILWLKLVLVMLCFCRVYVMGQSAGAHIGACAIVDQAIKELGEGESTSWSVSQIHAYFGLSGG